MNLIDVAKQFATPEACNDFLEQMRWPDGAECVHCDSKRVSKYVKQAGTRARKNPKTGEVETKAVPARILYVCLDCKKQFSVTEGTIFNDTHLPLDKWFMAVALMVNAKKGLLAMQLKRDLKTACKISWYLSHRIRKSVGLCELAGEEPLTGTVEMDETYMGSNKYDKRRKRGKYEKEPVFGMVARDGKAKIFHVPQMNRHSIASKITDNIAIDASAIYTGESVLYKRMHQGVDASKHAIVNHSAKEWVRGDVHTGTVDGYWGLLERGVIGSFHQISVKHLHRYLSEFQFRWNNRKHQEIFMLVIAALVIGSALPYSELIKSIDEQPSAGPEAELDGEVF